MYWVPNKKPTFWGAVLQFKSAVSQETMYQPVGYGSNFLQRKAHLQAESDA